MIGVAPPCVVRARARARDRARARARARARVRVRVRLPQGRERDGLEQADEGERRGELE